MENLQELVLEEDMEVLEWSVEEDMEEAMMKDLTPSISSMEYMMTSTTLTLVKLELVIREVMLRESTLLLFLMVGFNMWSTMLMVDMVGLWWMLSMMGRLDILMLYIMVDMDMEVFEGHIELLDI